MKLQYILDRLKEQSTWRGIVLVLGVLGVNLEPDKWQAITLAGIALVGLIEVFAKEKK